MFYSIFGDQFASILLQFHTFIKMNDISFLFLDAVWFRIHFEVIGHFLEGNESFA